MIGHNNPTKRKIRKLGKKSIQKEILAQSEVLLEELLQEAKQNEDNPQSILTKPSRTHSNSTIASKPHYLTQLQNSNQQLRSAIAHKTQQINQISQKINLTDKKYQTLIQNQNNLIRERILAISKEKSIVQRNPQSPNNSKNQLSHLRKKLQGINLKKE